MAQQSLPYGLIDNDPNHANDITNREGWKRAAEMFADYYADRSTIVSSGDSLFAGELTTEEKIAAADAYCVTNGKTILHIPFAHLGYNVTLCPPSAGVQRVREGGNYSIYDVLAYGAGFVGGDDAICINYALTAAPRGTPVVCPVTVAGYTINSQIVVPTGGLLQGSFRGPGYTRWAETIGLSLGVTPGSTFFKITSTSISPIVLRTNSRVEGIVFWYPNQNWDITSLAESFTTYPATIELGDDVIVDVDHPSVWDCHFLGATLCINQHRTDGTAIRSPEIGRCSGVLMGEFLRIRRAGDVTRIFQCHFSPSAATNYVGDSSVGGNTTVFQTKCAQVTTVLNLGSVDGLEVIQFFNYGAKYGVHYSPNFYTGDVNEGAAGSFTNCAFDAVYQAFRVDRDDNVFPINITNGWFAPLFRPNGVAGDAATQSFISLATSLERLRIHVSNVRVYGNSVNEFSTGYSGSADYAFNADGAQASSTFILGTDWAFHNLNTGLVPSNLTGTVVLGDHSLADALQDFKHPRDLDAAGGYRQTIDGWVQDNVPANQADTEMTRALGRWRAVRAGSITGVLVTATETTTAGQLIVKVFKNTGLAGAAGADTLLWTALNTGTPTRNTDTQAKDTDTFIAGDELYAVYTTDAAWLPVTSDIRVAIEVET